MPYRLKENIPDFDVVDGPFAGRRYRRGEIYAEIPPTEEDRFEEVSVKSEELGVKSRKTASPPDFVSSHPPIAASPDPAHGGDDNA